MIADREETKPSVYVEEQIYDGFPDREDQVLMFAFHETEWVNRAALFTGLADPRLQVLGDRLLHTEAPEVMPAEALTGYRAVVAKRLMAEEGAVPWLTVPQAMREAEELLCGLTGAKAVLLRGLRVYLRGIWEEARARID